MRGDELAFLDLIVRPEIAHYFLDQLFDLCYENTLRIYEQIPGKVHISIVAEDEVHQEVLNNIQILGEGGGYILGPCHNIQSVSLPENIIIMYRTGWEYGWVQ